MVDSNVTVLSLTRSGYISLVCAGFESWGCEVELSLVVSYSLQWHVVLFVETRVSSSGETWQAKLIEM